MYEKFIPFNVLVPTTHVDETFAGPASTTSKGAQPVRVCAVSVGSHWASNDFALNRKIVIRILILSMLNWSWGLAIFYRKLAQAASEI